MFLRYYNAYFPVRKISVKRNSPLRYPAHILELKNSVAALNTMAAYDNKYRKYFHHYRDLLTTSIDEYRRKVNDRKLLLSTNKSKDMWRIINTGIGKKPSFTLPQPDNLESLANNFVCQQTNLKL